MFDMQPGFDCFRKLSSQHARPNSLRTARSARLNQLFIETIDHMKFITATSS